MTLAKDSRGDSSQVNYPMRFFSRRDMCLNSKYNKQKSGFIAKKQQWGSVDGNLVRGRVLLLETDLMDFCWRQTRVIKRGGWGIRNLNRPRAGSFHYWLGKILAQTGISRPKTKPQVGPSEKEDSEESPPEFGHREESLSVSLSSEVSGLSSWCFLV